MPSRLCTRSKSATDRTRKASAISASSFGQPPAGLDTIMSRTSVISAATPDGKEKSHRSEYDGARWLDEEQHQERQADQGGGDAEHAESDPSRGLSVLALRLCQHDRGRTEAEEEEDCGKDSQSQQPDSANVLSEPHRDEECHPHRYGADQSGDEKNGDKSNSQGSSALEVALLLHRNPSLASVATPIAQT